MGYLSPLLAVRVTGGRKSPLIPPAFAGAATRRQAFSKGERTWEGLTGRLLRPPACAGVPRNDRKL
jgi:hypothetical protein